MKVHNNTGVQVDLEVVGEYGTFANPVVKDECGHEFVAEPFFASPSGLVSMCQSKGCSYCNSPVAGCRHDHEGEEVQWWI